MSEQRVRLIVGLGEDDTRVTVAGAIDDVLWDIMDDEEWNALRGRVVEVSGMADGDIPEWREIIVTLDAEALAAACRPVKLEGSVTAPPTTGESDG